MGGGVVIVLWRTNIKVKEGFSYLVHNPNLPWNEMAPLLGMKFEHPGQLKDCLINYGVANGYQLWYRRNDYRNISVLCGKNVKEGRCSSQKGKQKVVEDIGRPRKNRIKHVTERVNQVSRAGRYMTCSNCWEKGHKQCKILHNLIKTKPQQEKRKPGRKRKQAANQQFNPPNADPTFEDSSSADPSAADSSVVDPSSADPRIAAMNGNRREKPRRKDAERVLEEAKRKGVYRKRGACGWRGPSERIANQRRKKEDPNGPGKKPDTALDVSD
ncbi:hypothetical protein Tco_1554178 [Tanacetum coccineum]